MAQNVTSYYCKNWKIIIIYLIITVIEIMVKMILMLMNKDDNKQQHF